MYIDIRISEEFIQPYHFLSFELGWDFAICFFLYPTTVTQAKQHFSFFFIHFCGPKLQGGAVSTAATLLGLCCLKRKHLPPGASGRCGRWVYSIYTLGWEIENASDHKGNSQSKLYPRRMYINVAFTRFRHPPRPPKKNQWYILTTMGKVSIISIFGRCRSFMKI